MAVTLAKNWKDEITPIVSDDVFDSDWSGRKFTPTQGRVYDKITSLALTDLSGVLPIGQGGTGQTTKSAAFNNLSPVTTLGDLIYGSAANTNSRLAGNTAATKKFLTQTGTGSTSAAPAWGAIAPADLGTGSPSSANFLRGDGSWAAVPTGITVGSTPVSSGTNNRVLYQSGGVVQQNDRLQFDGSDLTLINPTAATSGAQTQNSPYLYLTGQKWRTDLGANESKPLRISNKPNVTNQYPNVLTPAFTLESFVNSSWHEFFQIKTLETDYLTARYKFANPDNAGWGGYLDIYYTGDFAFRNLSGNYSGLQTQLVGLSPSGYPSIVFKDNYNPEFRAHYGGRILFAAGRPAWLWGDNVGNTGSEYVQSDLNVGIGTTSTPAAGLHVLKTTEQLRLGYDGSHYLNAVVNAAGVATIDGGTGRAVKFASGLPWGFDGVTPTATQSGWSVTNYGPKRDFDASADGLPELMDLVCTLVADLIGKGILKA